MQAESLRELEVAGFVKLFNISSWNIWLELFSSKAIPFSHFLPTHWTEYKHNKLRPAILFIKVITSMKRVCCLAHLLVGKGHTNAVKAGLNCFVLKVSIALRVCLVQCLTKFSFFSFSFSHPFGDLLVKLSIPVPDLMLEQATLFLCLFYLHLTFF